MFRRATGLVGCLLVSLSCCFAAFSQPQLANPAKPADGSLPVYNFDTRTFGLRRAEEHADCCFCGHDIVRSLNLDANRRFGLDAAHTVRLSARSAFDFFEPAIEVREIDLEGLKKILQRDPKDTRPLLINFWATWCDGCREEFPDLVKIDNDYRDRLNFVSVTLDDISEIKTTVPAFLKTMNAKMPVVLLNVKDPEPAIHAVDATWDGAMPATYLYDKDGQVVFKHFGAIKPAELRSAIDKAVGSKQ